MRSVTGSDPGGMSNVYKATDLILERTVAVKILAEHLSDDERFVARFRREALAVAKLIHPNIVQVYDTGVDESRHFIVMEFVDGRSGAQILQRQGPVGPEITAEAGAQACAGLDYAHRRGIIHRDVKPGNLMFVGGPVGGGELTVKLTDFGIARAVAQTRITQVGSVVGTAAYLAPEQVRGEEATPATDVYALGVVLYQFLTGRLPYEGSTLAELAVRQQNERPLPPSTYNDEVPETLGAAVLRALEGDPARRYGSADELATGLQRGMQGEDVTLPEGAGTAATNVLGGETATGRLDQTERTEFRPAPSQTRRPVPARAAAASAPGAGPAAQAKRLLALRAADAGPGRAGPDRRRGRHRGDHLDRQGDRGEGRRSRRRHRRQGGRRIQGPGRGKHQVRAALAVLAALVVVATLAGVAGLAASPAGAQLAAEEPQLIERGGIGELRLGRTIEALRELELIEGAEPGCELAPGQRVAPLTAPLDGFAVFYPGERLSSIVLTEGAETDRGVGIGSSAAAARRAYPRAPYFKPQPRDPIPVGFIWVGGTRNPVMTLIVDPHSHRVEEIAVPRPVICE